MADEQRPCNDDKAVLIFVTLGPIILGLLVPLIVWFLKKDTFGDYAKNITKGMLNFQLTLTLTVIVLVIISFIIPAAYLLTWLISLYSLIISIMAFLAVNKGCEFDYPTTVQFVK